MAASTLAEKLGIPYSENFDHEEILAVYYRKQGKLKVHLCPDWDFMVIHANSPEFEACRCDKDAL